MPKSFIVLLYILVGIGTMLEGGLEQQIVPSQRWGNRGPDVPDLCSFFSPEAFQGLGCPSRRGYGLLGIWEPSCIHS